MDDWELSLESIFELEQCFCSCFPKCSNICPNYGKEDFGPPVHILTFKNKITKEEMKFKIHKMEEIKE